MKMITVRSDSRVRAQSTACLRWAVIPLSAYKPNEHHSEDTEEIVC